MSMQLLRLDVMRSEDAIAKARNRTALFISV